MHAVPRLMTAAGVGGLLVAAVAVFSPLDTWGAHSFAAHMAQHLVLIVGAAPLLAWSWRLPQRSWLGTAEAGWAAAAAFALAILFWHLPAAHDWALANPVVHWLDHLTMLGTAVLFWRLVAFAPPTGLGRGASVLILWLISLQGALLSAIIMFAPGQLCASYAGNPLGDQVAAGLLMCIPASLVYCGSTVWALALLFSDGRTHVG